MTGLLVSVRDAAEAQDALACGVDLIDVKEPSRGSLGAATPPVWKAVHALVGDRVPCSVALGELCDDSISALARQVPTVAYAKIGLAGCTFDRTWPRTWNAALSQVPSSVRWVAVSYADFAAARAPSPEDVIHHAQAIGCAAVLFDTFEKTSGDLFSHLEESRLSDLVASIRQSGMMVVLGGGLRGDAIERAVELDPDYVAVRGAVCRGQRDAVLDVELTRNVALRVRGARGTRKARAEILPRA